MIKEVESTAPEAEEPATAFLQAMNGATDKNNNGMYKNNFIFYFKTKIEEQNRYQLLVIPHTGRSLTVALQLVNDYQNYHYNYC
jgi:hypothetical protein